jgi:hypothetical protein
VFGNLDYEDLTTEQAKTLDGAALLVINARQQAATMLDDAGIVHVDEAGDSMFGSPCTGTFDSSPCPCSDYSGPGPCQTRIAPPGVPLQDSTARCSHRAILHLPS